MSIIKRIRTDFHAMNLIYPFCGGIAMAILSVVTLMSSNCHPIYQWMLLPRGALPYFIFALISVTMFFLFGAALGSLFAICHCKQSNCFSVIMIIFDVIATMLWYYVLFRSFHGLIAIMLLFVCMGLELILIRENLFANSITVILLVLIIFIRLHFLWLNIGINFLN